MVAIPTKKKINVSGSYSYIMYAKVCARIPPKILRIPSSQIFCAHLSEKNTLNPEIFFNLTFRKEEVCGFLSVYFYFVRRATQHSERQTENFIVSKFEV